MQATIEKLLIAIGLAGLAGIVFFLVGNPSSLPPNTESPQPDTAIQQDQIAEPGTVAGARSRAVAYQTEPGNSAQPNSLPAAQDELAINIDAHCQEKSAIAPERSAQSNIRQRLAIDVNSPLESSAFFTERSLYWIFEGYHYQITATWERDQPARYRMEFYRAPAPDFSEQVEAVEMPPIAAEGIDALSASEMQDSLLQEFQARGGVPAGKVMIVRAIDQTAGEMHELTVFDDRLLNWSFPHGVCLLNQEGDALDCSCDQQPHRHGHA